VKLYTTPKTTERQFNQMGDLMKSVIFAIEVPFEGDRRLFTMKPNNSEPTQILAYLEAQKLTLYVATFNLAPEQIQRQFDQMLSGIERHLEWQAETLRNFPTQFQQAVHNAVNLRLAVFNRGATISSALKFPLKTRPNAPDLTIPIRRTAIVPTPSVTTLSNSQAQAILAEEHYQSILAVMENMARAMEFSPTAFATLGEEALRFNFLVLLNGLYEGAASGETFNYQGKTDILIRDKNVNLFVAECKIWSGASDFAAAVAQLQRYVTWRDTKTAIVLFNRNKGFSAVIESAVQVLNRHPQRRSGPIQIAETRYRYTFSQVNDLAREYTLTLLLFNVPTPT
jgi:hypothetical protein